MCFSAEASFGASAVLGLAGVFAIKNAKTTQQKFFAAIPIIFAVQQFIEGFLWIALQNDRIFLKQISTYSFLIIAQFIWPIWVPFSILSMEKKDKRRKILNLLLLFGIITSLYLGYCVLFFNVDAQIREHHIEYLLDYPPEYKLFIAACYFLSTVVPPFISGIKGMKLLGLLILLSLIISQLLFTEYTISVWCFFAALMSVVVFMIIKRLNTVEEINSENSAKL